jgi:hypothetical protein
VFLLPDQNPEDEEWPETGEEKGFLRRNLLKIGGVTLVAGFAGATMASRDRGIFPVPQNPNTSSTPVDTPTNTPPEEAETPTPTPSVDLELEVLQEPPPLPAIWTDENNVENYHTGLKTVAQTDNGSLGTIKLQNNKDTLQKWDKQNKTLDTTQKLPIKQLHPGENQLTIQTEKFGEQTTTTAQKQVPELKKLDIKPGTNKSIRDQVSQEYLNQNQVPENHPIYTNYQTPNQLKYNKYHIDLTALEWWHDNDVQNIFPEETQKFVQSVGPREQATGIAKEAMINGEATLYQNWEESQYENGHFIYNDEENGRGLVQADSAREALDWLHPYLFNWQRKYEGSGPISTEDEIYAAAIQETLDGHTDIDTHAWAFDLPTTARSTHGNGLIWDETNNELRILETISGPVTQTPEEVEKGNFQYHPLIEDSGYLIEENDGYQEWWHPLRFDGTNPDFSLKFEDGKDYASRALIGISTAWHDEDRDNSEWWTEAGVALTTEYVSDRIDKLANYNDNSFDFNQLKQESKLMNHLWEEHNGNAVMYLDKEDNLAVAEGVDDQVLEDIWKDEEGQYDDFDAYIEQQVRSGDVSYEQLDSMLEGQKVPA